MHRCHEHQDKVDRDFDALMEVALAEFLAKQEDMRKELTGHETWHFDLDCCTLTLDGGAEKACTLPITPIATYFPSEESWIWAWADDSLPALARDKSAKIRKLTQKTQYRIFELSPFRITRDEVDEPCALALHQLGGRGIFLGQGR